MSQITRITGGDEREQSRSNLNARPKEDSNPKRVGMNIDDNGRQGTKDREEEEHSTRHHEEIQYCISVTGVER